MEKISLSLKNEVYSQTQLDTTVVGFGDTTICVNHAFRNPHKAERAFINSDLLPFSHTDTGGFQHVFLHLRS